jgi:cell division transport system ATP-binding protein
VQRGLHEAAGPARFAAIIAAGPDPRSMIQAFHVYKQYDRESIALADVTLNVDKGEFCFLTGPSGAGKTTFLKLVFREELPSQGQILVGGRNVTAIPLGQIPELRRSIGVVFQDFKLLKRKTIIENVAFVLRILGVPPREQKRRAFAALKAVGLHHKMHAYPLQLSGGEQQRVAIARALINEPMLLLADEPTGNLDPEMAQEIMRLFLEVNARGTTVVVATHDREMIQRMGKRVISLERGRVASA